MKHWAKMVCAIVALGFLTGCSEQEYSLVQYVEKVQPTQLAAVEFPCAMAGELLMAEEVECYTGPYWEDGSGETVENIAALMVYNPTNKMLEFGAFSLEQDGKKLYFFAYRVPPESRCLILEYEKKPWSANAITDCRMLEARWTSQEFSREQIDYLGLDHTLTVINRDGRQLSQVTVWYKRYDQERQCYIGGIAYSSRFLLLQPEEHRTILPTHYRAGECRIVRITLEI